MSIAVPIILLENRLFLDFIASILIKQLLWNPVYTLFFVQLKGFTGGYLILFRIGFWFVDFFFLPFLSNKLVALVFFPF